MTRPLNRPVAPPPQASTFDRALAAHQQGRLTEAQQLYAQVPPSDNRYAMALHNRGLIKHQAGDHAGALELVQQSLNLLPNIPQWLVGLAHIQLSLGQMNEAIAACDRVLAIDPRNVSAWNNKGCAFVNLSLHDQAIACWDHALAIAPNFAPAWANRSAALRSIGQYDLALASLERLLQLTPKDIGGWIDLGDAMYAKSRYEKALTSFEKALALDPSRRDVSIRAMISMQRIGRWSGIEQRWQHELELIQTSGAIKFAFPMLAHPHISARQLTDGLRALVSSQFGHITSAPFERSIASKRLRIAYLSTDFREHAMTQLMAGVFEHHDRERFEVTAVALKPIPPSPMGKRLADTFERIIDVTDQSNDQIVTLMRELNIDIAIDLMGYTEGNRFGIFARRCAPIQVNYLGYPGTSGASFIDYILGDRWVTPLDQADTFSEKIVLMPESFQANDDKRQIAPETPSRAALGLPESSFVFCCLNNTYKITPMVFDIWMRLLAQVPGSVLWLLAETETAETNLRAETQARGVDPGRLVFARRAPYEQYLAQYRQADLFLDTVPFNAGTTASDALWAGLPVLTQLGQTFAGRMAASLLDAVGLPELITRSEQEYEQLALKLATEPAVLKGYRERLAANLPTAPLFDTARFTHHLEAAYQMMWQRHEQGQAPDHIAVPALPVAARASSPIA